MNLDEKKRLALLKRKNQFRLEAPKYLKKLESIYGANSKFEIVQLEDVEEIHPRLRALGYVQKFSARYYVDDWTHIKSILHDLSPKLNSTNYFTIQSLSKYWFIKADTAFVIENFKSILEIDGDGFEVYDLGIRNGLRLELYEHYYMFENEKIYGFGYEIDLWGEDWISLLIDK
ncbi:hypothetical protein [Lewinella sp. 4G2]|uniref:hypothetical protein n=1 Tax=Lewinella sp. 4G2 TaxID=1803372 RepID=UPI0007B4ED48|nr:hypothetical protein [Lewinella sp. 4G2]OAV45110.1 hypothetical protein A3850_011690 [Lewinella sp. 4G2]